MRTLYFSTLAIIACSVLGYSQTVFDAKVDIEWIPSEVVVKKSPLKYQILFIGEFHEVQTVDNNGQPNGTALAKQWHDFIGFTADDASSDLGWISVNHEMIYADDKIGDGGGMTVFKVRRDPSSDTLVIVDQTLADGRSGKFFNVDFVNTVGETGMNCGGIQSTVDGRIWTAEEWFRSDNESIYDDGDGVRDTTDWTVKTDIPGNFNGATISRYQNFNYMVEIDPRTAKAIRKQFNWGRQPFEGGVVMPDNRTVYLGADATPGFLTRFVADTPGDFTRGTTSVYKQNSGSYSGSWVEIDNTDIEKMLNFSDEAVAAGATMFNRLEWVAYNPGDGKVYVTETGRDNPAGRWSDEAEEGATYARHHLDRAAAQGTTVDADEYWDYYGRVIVLDPSDNSVRSYIEGGPLYEGRDAEEPRFEPYPERHLSNPDGLNFLYVNGKSFMVILEDLNGTSYGRVHIGVANRSCEAYLLSMDDEPTIDNLIRISVGPMGAELTGACVTADGKTLLINSQHPWPTNQFPYNNSLTYAITGWDKVVTSIKEDDNDPNGASGLKIYPNPTTRMVTFNKYADVALYDMNGRRIKVVRNTNRLDVSTLSPGAYILKTGDGETTKLIIE